jgi:hypothetical protein
MRTGLLFVVGFVGLVSGGFLLLGDIGATGTPEDVVVEQVNANLVRVRVAGQWEEFPLMPLSDQLCQGQNRLFEKYCPDTLFAPDKSL